MIPSTPPRQPGYGFLFFPPYRLQGYSIAGEETFVQIPEMDLCFDIGRAPRMALSSNFVALTHGHMDHTAGLAYYFSQRVFQGMVPGTVFCPAPLATALRTLMHAWIEVEAQRTPHNIIAMEPGQASEEVELKNHLYLRAFATNHTVPSLGYVVVEKRSKLREEFTGLPQEKLVELKKTGQAITYIREVPLIAYMGDTSPGSFFDRPDVANAKILITECTFTEDDHRDRAKAGKHLHISDIIRIAEKSNAENIVLTHLSRRTHMGDARRQLDKLLPQELRTRVHLFMDHRANSARFNSQVEASDIPANETDED